MEFYKIFKPLTANPFRSTVNYMEFEPCAALKPYIRCFWGAKMPYSPAVRKVSPQKLVIPDTCMDIIFYINYTENQIKNTFCGINDTSFYSMETLRPDLMLSTFGIRFYAWSAVLFSDESMRNAKNINVDAGAYFSRLKRELEQLFFDITDIHTRIAVTQAYLLKHIHLEREHPVVMGAVSEILENEGNITMVQLAKEIHTGSRQLERLFKEYIGTSPKQLSSLIRYQYLWSHIVHNGKLNILDEVFRLGYTDQSHLLKDFKRFHTLTPTEARALALQDVAFLQENRG